MGRKGASKAPKITIPQETKESEIQKLEGILSDPRSLTAYALGKFKGDEDKAKKEIEKRLHKLGSDVVAPFT